MKENLNSRIKEGMEEMKQILSNKIDISQIKPGDHIYSWRTAWLYAHHGIYAGDDKVIHFTRGGGQEIGTGTVLDRIIFSSSPTNSGNPCLKCGDQSNSDGVIASCLNCFLSGGDLYLFKYSVSPATFLAKARGGTCTLALSDPPEDVLHRAQFLLEKGFGVYNIFKNNCEDFAIYCKTGLLVFTTLSVGRSGQAATFLAATSAIISSPLRFLTVSFSGLAVVGCGIYCISRFVSDMGIRRDVIKISVERLVGSTTLNESQALEPQASIESAMEPEACVKKPEETQAFIESAMEPEACVKKPEETQAFIESAMEPEACVKKPEETQAFIESAMEPEACVKKPEETQALIPKDPQVPVERLEESQALVEEPKAAQALVATGKGE